MAGKSRNLLTSPEPVGDKWPLVFSRTVRRDPDPQLARDPNRDRQSRWCQGFDPDFWLPALLCPRWKTLCYPRSRTREAVQQWQAFLAALQTEYLGPFNMPEEAATLAADLENDLALIRAVAPELLEEERTADRKGDKSAPKTPRSTEVQDLIRWLNRELPKGRSKNDIALEFTEENPKRAKSLLRQVLRFKHLLDE